MIEKVLDEPNFQSYDFMTISETHYGHHKDCDANTSILCPPKSPPKQLNSLFYCQWISTFFDLWAMGREVMPRFCPQLTSLTSFTLSFKI